VVTLIAGAGVTQFSNCFERDRLNGEIRHYKEAVTVTRKRLNDSTEVIITERIASQKYKKELKDSKHALSNAEMSMMNMARAIGIKDRNIRSLSSFNASAVQDFAITLERTVQDSMELRGSYKSKYRNLLISLISEGDSFRANIKDSLVAPIIPIVHKKKTDYLAHKGLTRLWKQIWERKKLYFTVISENPNVTITHPEHISVIKKKGFFKRLFNK